MTVTEQTMVNLAKSMLPLNFQSKSTDDQMLAYLNVVLADINLHTPYTEYTLENMPTTWRYLVAYGATIFANMFVELGYALKDFSYNDYGLNLNIDRGGKIRNVTQQMVKAYERMIWSAKKQVFVNVRAQGFGMPKFQSSIGGLLKTVFGSSYAWNSSPNG